jgi:APA family basic amino acid/polyamine antiporter
MTDPSVTPNKPAAVAGDGHITKEPLPHDHHEDGLDTEFKRGLGLFDATMIVVGSMIGSGIFIVSAQMSREIGSPGWLLVAWLITGVLTLAGALSYGELAALIPRAGGQYVFLREGLSPLWGFLYGWTFFLVIQTGTIAAVCVAFGRFLGILWPAINEGNYLIQPIHLSQGYAVSLSTAQLVGVLLVALLTWTNMSGLDYGKWVQNLFTVAKVGALFALIVVGLTLGWNASAIQGNFGDLWTPRGYTVLDTATGLTAATAFGLFVALCVAQTGSLFSADAWANVALAAGEVRNPRRTLPLAMALGTGLVIALYLLANVAYLVTLPLADIQNAPEDRVGTETLKAIIPGTAVTLMAIAIMVSSFGCINGLILAGARAYYAMARDGLFFRQVGRLNNARVPGWGLALQGVWTALLVLPRTWKGKFNQDGVPEYGSLYGDLLEYIMSAALLFYVLTIIGLFRLRWTKPDAMRPYKAFGYPVVPALYILGASVIVLVLFVYRPVTTGPVLVILLLGVPVYYLWRQRSSSKNPFRI